MATLAPFPAPTQAADGHPRRAFSIADVERMLEAGVLDPEEKFELIGGEIVPMSPQRRLHSVLRDRIAKAFIPLLPAPLDVYQEFTVRVGKDLLEPDIVIAPRQPLTRDYASIEEIRLAIEVADSSLSRDRDLKAPSYAAAGLAELWILDATALVTWVLRAPAERGYDDMAQIPFAAQLTPLCAPAAALRFSDLMG